MELSEVEERYRKKMSELGGEGRIARVVSLFEAGKEIIAQRVLAEDPTLSGKKLKLEVARIMYRKDPGIQKLIDEIEARDG